MYFGKKGSAYRFSSPLKAICTGRLAISLCSIVNTKKLGIDTVKQYLYDIRLKYYISILIIPHILLSPIHLNVSITQIIDAIGIRCV